MDRKSRESFAAELRRRRDELCREVADAEHDLSDLAENQDPEFEERGREETDAQVLGRLDNRGKHEIEEIDAALLRIADGSYGACIECGEKIAIERLRAVPETELCVDCAAQDESPLDRCVRDALGAAAQMPGVVGAHFCVADMPASRMVPREREGRPTTIPAWIVLLEGITREAVGEAADRHFAPERLIEHGAAASIERDLYAVQITVSKP